MYEITKTFEQWFFNLDFAEQIKQINVKSSQVNKAKLSFDKALQAQVDYGFNRTGIRGGKYTTLQAQVDRKGEALNALLVQLKFMVANI